MTGYGRGTCEVAGRRLVVEVRSVNHRFLELKLRMPWVDAALEAHVTAAVRARLARGALTVNVRDEGGGAGQAVRADVGLARQYHQALTEVAPGDRLHRAGVAGVGGGAARRHHLRGERQRSGGAVARSWRPGWRRRWWRSSLRGPAKGRRCAPICARAWPRWRRCSSDLGVLTSDAPEQHRKKLRERLERALKPGELDPQRLAQEMAILADKSDVTEELTRMATHVAEARRLTDEDGANGRRLDFLTQELNREVNTIGAKSQSAQVAARVVDAKAEVERLREQIQNVE